MIESRWDSGEDGQPVMPPVIYPERKSGFECPCLTAQYAAVKRKWQHWQHLTLVVDDNSERLATLATFFVRSWEWGEKCRVRSGEWETHLPVYRGQLLFHVPWTGRASKKACPLFDLASMYGVNEQ